MSAASFDWFPDWSRDVCILVAGGPSAKDAPLEIARGRARALVVNEGYRLAPWADALYAADAHWWEKKKGCREFKGLRISQSDQAAKMYGGIREVGLRRVGGFVTDPKGLLGAGSDEFGTGANSGFQAVNLAIQFGAKRIVLVGYDMTIDHGVHWHGSHEHGFNNPTARGIARWGRVLDRTAKQLAELGVKVVNVSPISALTAFPKMDLEQALDSF